MKPALIVIGTLALAAVIASASQFAKERSTGALVQLLGAAFLVVVIFCHAAEAFRLFPAMGWGRPDSPGHYLDLVSAVAGLALLSLGYVSRKAIKRRPPA